MNLQAFREIVDGTSPGITACEGDLRRLDHYVGLDHGPAYTRNAVSEALYARVKGCFTSGHAEVWRICKSLRRDLIRAHVLRGAPLDPYFEVIDHLQDAVRNVGNARAPIEGDWELAIRSAIDHVQIQSWGTPNREKVYARDFMVAASARLLRDAGFAIRLEPGRLSSEEAAEVRLVATIEDFVAAIGGLNVARRIFKEISRHYDAEQQRYHLVRRTSTTGEGLPQVPWGYLIQLAVKHLHGRKPHVDADIQWQKLCTLAQAFAAVIDVQPYAPTLWGAMNAFALLPYLQEIAVYDTLFRVPQMRPADVAKLARGVLDWLDWRASTNEGWSIDEVIEIVSYLLDPARDARGPILFDEADIRRACPRIQRKIVTQILDEVLSHPPTGANQKFSRPTDAPTPENPDLKDAGHDFFLRPLLHLSGRRFVLLDRSVCAPACLEALLTPLRKEISEFDDKVGLAVERFLQTEFASHGIAIVGGEYDVGGEHGECDMVVEVPGSVIFFEVKKKPLTRRARAGSDAHLLLDLSGSLLAAQAQAGWHEERLRRHGHLDLASNGTIERVELNGREIERVAVSLLDFGSFQDRIVLKQFLEATLTATFTPVAAHLNTKFDEINKALAEIREQVAALHPGQKEINQPFFHCWFLSVPQVVILLDGVADSAGFKSALWSCRHIVTGSSDLYFDLSYMKRLKMNAAAKSE